MDFDTQGTYGERLWNYEVLMGRGGLYCRDNSRILPSGLNVSTMSWSSCWACLLRGDRWAGRWLVVATGEVECCALDKAYRRHGILT